MDEHPKVTRARQNPELMRQLAESLADYQAGVLPSRGEDVQEIARLQHDNERLRAVIRRLLTGIELAYESEGTLSGITDDMLSDAEAALAGDTGAEG